jgi:uncharacterized damage-inducible protein DinB
MDTMNSTQAQVISAEQLLEHWLGHRNLTRRVIEAFPETEMFTFSIGGMRPLADLIAELIGIGAPGVNQIATGSDTVLEEELHHDNKKQNVLDAWDASTNAIATNWANIAPERFQEDILAFGQYPGSVWSTVFYFIDNEIHHRAQAYVYLRALGIKPPDFYER